jgi:Tol biopolymer transport system component
LKQVIGLILTVEVLLSVGCGEDKGTNSEDWSPPDYSSVRITNLTGKLAGSMCLGCPLIIFDIANNNHHQLTKDVGSDPSWSSDGERLAYVSSGSIYATDANGSNVTMLVEIGADPALSPDGERLAFIKYDNSNQSLNLSVLNLANREEITLAQDALWPSWHPDGTRLAYSQIYFADNAPDVSQFQSYVVDLTSSGSQPLVRGLMPIWSPDGQRLAFVRADPARIVEQDSENEMGTGMGSGIDLYVANADGSGEELLYQSQQPIASFFFGLEAIHEWSQDSQELLITVVTNRLSDGCGEDTGTQPPEDFVSTPDCHRISDAEVHLMDIGSGTSRMVSDKIVNPAWYSE